MNGEMFDENENGVAVDITDNNDILHEISMFKNGEITYHKQDGYPDDPSQRSQEGNEHVNQARRFAKYYVFAEQGYDTLEYTENPAYIDAVRQAIADLSPAVFKGHFGALHRQLRSHHEDVERPITLPSGVRKPNAVVYEQDVYLGVDLTDESITDQVQRLSTANGLDLNDHTAVQPASDLSEAALDRWRAFGEDLAESVDREGLEPELTISAVSGIHVSYPGTRGQQQIQEADTPLDRQPEARLEMLPYAPETIKEFQAFLDHHLRCQVRDCFVKMGTVPPEPHQVTGFGKFRDARRYDHFEMYPELHKQDGDHTPLIS